MDVTCSGCRERDSRLAEAQAQLAEAQAQLAGLQARLAALEAEVARLKGKKERPQSNSKPSGLEKTNRDASLEGKRPGSEKRSKTQELTIHREIVLPPKELPPNSTFKGHEPFVVQDLVIEPCNTRYQIEVWETPAGERVCGELPAGLRGHFGAGLVGFVMQQHYEANVTQPRLLEELHDFGIDISTGQINRLLTEQHEEFHAEKDELLPAGLAASTYVNVDDSGAPHQGRYGSCLCISNEWFATFHSSDSKSRCKFLEVMRCGHTDYVLNEIAWAYLEEQGLPAKLLRRLRDHACREFVAVEAWEGHLTALGIKNLQQRRTVTEGALLGSAVAHGLDPELGILSDGGRQYALLVHGLCWVHQERNLAKLVPSGTEEQRALEEVLTAVWQLYADLKAYRLAPSAAEAQRLETCFDALVGRTTCFAELTAALERMGTSRAGLLRVLTRPDLPLHNNTVERDFRSWATKRKISAGTRGDLGKRCRDTFLSLKATCRKLGLRFWAYLQDRLFKAGRIPRLPELVRAKATGSATR